MSEIGAIAVPASFILVRPRRCVVALAVERLTANRVTENGIVTLTFVKV